MQHYYRTVTKESFLKLAKSTLTEQEFNSLSDSPRDHTIFGVITAKVAEIYFGLSATELRELVKKNGERIAEECQRHRGGITRVVSFMNAIVDILNEGIKR